MCPVTEDTALEDYILAFAYAPGPTGRGASIGGKTVLQKLLVRLRKNLESVPGKEIPHLYGPFDEQTQAAFEQLETSGYLPTSPDSPSIQLTEKGEREARKAWNDLDPDVRKIIESIKRFLVDLNTDEVLA